MQGGQNRSSTGAQQNNSTTDPQSRGNTTGTNRSGSNNNNASGNNNMDCIDGDTDRSRTTAGTGAGTVGGSSSTGNRIACDNTGTRKNTNPGQVR